MAGFEYLSARRATPPSHYRTRFSQRIKPSQQLRISPPPWRPAGLRRWIDQFERFTGLQIRSRVVRGRANGFNHQRFAAAVIQQVTYANGIPPLDPKGISFGLQVSSQFLDPQVIDRCWGRHSNLLGQDRCQGSTCPLCEAKLRPSAWPPVTCQSSFRLRAASH